MAYRGPDPERAEGVCPTVEIDYRLPRPAFWHYESLNAVREQAPFVWNTVPQGFWMLNRYDQVRDALQRPDVFTSDILSPLGDPDAKTRLLPQHLNGDEHRMFRHVLNPGSRPARCSASSRWPASGVAPSSTSSCRAVIATSPPISP